MINKEDIQFSIKSMVDDFGRVFFYQNRVFRAINSDMVDYCTKLLNNKLFNELITKGLVPKTSISTLELSGYSLILEHERLKEIKQHEWSFEMFKEAALMVLRVNEICNKYGYELKDAHTFNILYKGVKPVWVDIGSIVPLQNKDRWRAYDEFVSVFYVPLQFALQNDNYIVRKLVESNFYRMQTLPYQTLWDSKLSGLIQQKHFYFDFYFRKHHIQRTDFFIPGLNKFTRRFNKYYHKLFKRPAVLFRYVRVDKTLDELKRYIENSSVSTVKTQWSNYHQFKYKSGNDLDVPKRFLRIIELINFYCKESESIIDLAGNEGYFSELVLERTSFEKIILIDYNAIAIDSAYNHFKNKNENRISIALLNFMFSNELENTIVRLKSDVAVALAVTHHLLLSQNYSLSVIFERIGSFARRYVVIEFMPLGLWSKHTEEGEDVPKWYTQNWFEDGFKNYFKILYVEQLESNRILYIGEKYD